MIEIGLAEGPERATPLELRAVRNADDVPACLDDLIVVGQPRSVRLTPEGAADDSDLARFIEAEAQSWHYHLVVLSCTFAPTESRHIASAWIQIRLAGDNASEPAEPVAASMEPTRLERIRDISVTAKIAVPCIFTTEIGVTGAGQAQQVLLEARYEGTSRPAWHFMETRQASVSGMQRLRLIVRAPAAAAATTGTINVGATVRYKRFGVKAFSYRSRTSGETAGPSFLLHRPDGVR